jgi:hypothetical protein
VSVMSPRGRAQPVSDPPPRTARHDPTAPIRPPSENPRDSGASIFWEALAIGMALVVYHNYDEFNAYLAEIGGN